MERSKYYDMMPLEIAVNGGSMPFTEKQKLEVKRKAAFRCCRCQNIGIDVHHIIPEKDGGTSELSNAAPLCQNCHDQFGDNPQKRKEITQMRDWWYDTCKNLYPETPTGNLDMLAEINSKLEDIQHGQSDLADLKATLRALSDKTIDGLTPATASTAATAIVNASTATSAIRLGENVYANCRCSKCGSSYGLLIGTDKCPNCGNSF